MLSLTKAFRRQWHSRYNGLERGTLDAEWVKRYLAHQVLQEGVQYYSLDGGAWPRPRAQTMDDRQYVYHPTAAVNGGSICIGYTYSLLDWVPEAHQSWSLSVSVQRIPSQMTAVEMDALKAALRTFGFRELRVRHHDQIARIKVPISDFDRALSHHERIVAAY